MPQKKGDQYSAARLTDDDKAEIRALARDPRIGERKGDARAAFVWACLSCAAGLAGAMHAASCDTGRTQSSRAL